MERDWKMKEHACEGLYSVAAVWKGSMVVYSDDTTLFILFHSFTYIVILYILLHPRTLFQHSSLATYFYSSTTMQSKQAFTAD